jgi:hypothetical protein
MSEKAPKVDEPKEGVKRLTFEDGLVVFINDAGDVFFRKGLAEITVENDEIRAIMAVRQKMKG